MNQLMHGPKLAGQSIADRVMAARHSISGQGLAKSVCKATTEEVMGPKKKHLDYLIQCTNEPNVSIPQLANLMIERTQSSSWCVVFKSLVSIHNLMNYGNERFTQYLASNNCTFNLNSFIDKTAVQGYDMSTYIRRYAKYLNEKCLSYRSMAFDFCKVKRGKDDGLLRTMSHEKLLKSIPVLQQQLDALLEFDVTPNELTNGVINAAFMLLFKDLIRLFACYNDGIINLLEKYFEMNKKHAREALDIYKKFLVRMERVGEILKVAESVGIDKGDIPDLAKAPSSLLEALEEHLKSLESSKKSGKHKSKEVTSAIDSFTAAANAAAAGVNASAISEDEKRRILEEESRALDQLRREKLNSPNSQPAASTNPFSTAAAPTDNSVDLFAGTGGGGDDLLALSGPNPFAESVITASQAQPAQASNPFAQTAMAPAPASTAQWGAPPPQPTGASAINSSSQQTTVTTTTTATNHTQFASDEAFAKAFGNATQNQQGFDGFGEVMMPMSMGGQNMNMGQQQQPLQVHPQPMMQQKKQDKLISGDLDSSLASLAGNLNMKGSSQVKKTEYNWTSGGGGPAKMTGAGTGGGWQTTTASTGFTQPMAQPMAGQPGMGMGYQQPQMMGGFQQQPMAMGQQRPIGMQQPMWGGGGQPMQPQSQTGVGGFGPPPATNSQANDPFGAL